MHIDKSTPNAHKNNTLRPYAFGHNLIHTLGIIAIASEANETAFSFVFMTRGMGGGERILETYEHAQNFYLN
ncbi:hypothetical protein BBL92_10905 [Vibrio parahaemolyticus]|nr:hypothetical protein BBL92_10905 [Vibrio parahaemolyticus]